MLIRTIDDVKPGTLAYRYSYGRSVGTVLYLPVTNSSTALLHNGHTLKKQTALGHNSPFMTFNGRIQLLLFRVPDCAICLPLRHCATKQNNLRYYFTNAFRVHNDDPYAALGLHYGATQTEIKAAFRKCATQLHPDVNKVDDPATAQKKFQKLSAAYEKLTKSSNGHPKLDDDEWQWSIWLRSTNIAESRTDVAGVLKSRPIPPVTDLCGSRTQQYVLGHPAGLGVSRRGEYIGTANCNKQPSKSVGDGINKWVEQKPYQPWNADKKPTKAST